MRVGLEPAALWRGVWVVYGHRVHRHHTASGCKDWSVNGEDLHFCVFFLKNDGEVSYFDIGIRVGSHHHKTWLGFRRDLSGRCPLFLTPSHPLENNKAIGNSVSDTDTSAIWSILTMFYR